MTKRLYDGYVIVKGTVSMSLEGICTQEEFSLWTRFTTVDDSEGLYEGCKWVAEQKRAEFVRGMESAWEDVRIRDWDWSYMVQPSLYQAEEIGGEQCIPY